MTIRHTTTSASTADNGATRPGRLRHRVVKAVAATTVVGVGLGALIVPAGASPSGPATTFTKARCNGAIDERLFVLGISENRINNAKRLTADQKAAEIAVIDAVQANLTDVNRPALAAATTKAAIRSACQAIYSDNRVYAVVVPQLFLTVRIDEYGNAADKFNPIIAEKKATGVDTTAVEALMASAAGHVDRAATFTSSVTVASYNADPAGARATFDQATAELNQALVDILNALKAYRDLPAAPA